MLMGLGAPIPSKAFSGMVLHYSTKTFNLDISIYHTESNIENFYIEVA